MFLKLTELSQNLLETLGQNRTLITEKEEIQKKCIMLGSMVNESKKAKEDAYAALEVSKSINEKQSRAHAEDGGRRQAG